MNKINFSIIDGCSKSYDELNFYLLEELRDAFKSSLNICDYNSPLSFSDILFKPILKYKSYTTMINDKFLYLDNTSDSYSTLIKFLVKKHNLRAILISYNTETELQNYSFTFFNGLQIRKVYSRLDEGKWEFFQQGEPCDFENLENYGKRKIRERLSIVDLKKYASEFGLNDISINHLLSINYSKHIYRI